MTRLNHFAAILATGEFSYGKVCEDCMFAIYGILEAENDPRTLEQVERAKKNCDTYEFTLGHLHEGKWSELCWHSNSDCQEDCDCERDEFSNSECSLCGTTLAGYRNDVIIIARTLLKHKMTQEQFDKLSDLCRRYDQSMHLADYRVHPENSIFTPGWVEAWIGGENRTSQTLYVGVAPDGSSHS